MSVDSCVDFRPDDASRIDTRTANVALSLNSLEQRHRPVAILPQRIKVLKEVGKFNLLIVEKGPSFKSRSLKLVLLTIVCGMILTLIYAPTVYNDRQPRSSSRFGEVGWIWDRTKFDPRYVSSLDIQWNDISKALENLHPAKGKLEIGLLNFNFTEFGHWKQMYPNTDLSVIRLDRAEKSVTWAKLYPEWIDEEEETKIPACPSLPEPEFRLGSQFDLIVVKLPCSKSGSWSRDVARLHLQLSAAKVAVASSRSTSPVHVLVVTDCFPIPNLFPCKYLARREGNAWLYKPDLSTLREKLRLPVGSCELAVPLKAKARLYSVRRRREAYATILHSADAYVCGAIAAAQSIRQAGSRRDLVILVDESISGEHRAGLESAGWKVRTIRRIRNPKARQDAYNEWNYSKFRLWQLTDYDKVVFVDADLLVLRSVDFLFAAPEISATGNNASLFNSGVMVIEPSNCTFGLLMEHVHEITSYNGGDQGYLNEIFTWWHRIPRRMNFLKHFWEGDSEAAKAQKTRLFAAEPPVLYVLHYLGMKPWLCFRDYDCNWNADIYRQFASDAAHARWWRVHDGMPENLRKFCFLSTRQKAALEWDRRQAEQANFSDGHWRRSIRDPRRGVCVEKFCSWESMLLHWGETNWTGASTVQVQGQVQVQANPSL
ncbi:UDP-glucuronate:xylan alpha-glucuronosyltransferase 1-like isoform X2 [Ananas comosus]|uniref:Hexosyltransferase n=1 Tax=Ananas comosus TaxID=4615 RepID=A0A6P5EVZ4_ANACO|nr:UDP-glucuronate:xylan alpha-glucuronosyltransferase 1-like isoform X2 [Ananas comosus]